MYIAPWASTAQKWKRRGGGEWGHNCNQDFIKVEQQNPTSEGSEDQKRSPEKFVSPMNS